MFRLDWLQAGGATRGKPRRDRTRRRRWPLLGSGLRWLCFKADVNQARSVIAASGSGLFSPCGFFGRVSSRVFNRSNGSAVAASRGVVSDAPVGVRDTAVGRRHVRPVIPSYPRVGSDHGAYVSLAIGSSDSVDRAEAHRRALRSRGWYRLRRQRSVQLERHPARRAIKPVAPDSGIRGSRGGATTTWPRRRSRRLSRPRGRPRRRRAGRRAITASADDQDPLDHIPPLDLPGEVTRSYRDAAGPSGGRVRNAKPADDANEEARRSTRRLRLPRRASST